jgi:hypothetical protein
MDGLAARDGLIKDEIDIICVVGIADSDGIDGLGLFVLDGFDGLTSVVGVVVGIDGL